MLEGQFQMQNGRLAIIEKSDISALAEGRPDSMQYTYIDYFDPLRAQQMYAASSSSSTALVSL